MESAEATWYRSVVKGALPVLLAALAIAGYAQRVDAQAPPAQEWFNPAMPTPDPAAEAARMRSNSEYWRRENARRAAAHKAAAAAAARERAMDARFEGAQCVQTMSRFEIDVRDSLRASQAPDLNLQRCTVQHRILKALGLFPSIERAERFDQMLDAAHD